jgi:hypothetical protein
MAGAPTADDDAFYVLDRRTFIPTILTQGPWDPRAQHGGPVAGLLASVVETTPALVPMQIVRLTVDLLRPVPLERLDVERQVVREGKRIQAVEVLLLCGSDLVARCSALRIRVGADVSAGAPPATEAPLPGPEDAIPPPIINTYVPGIRRAVDLRRVPPDLAGGRSITWIEVRVPVVAGKVTDGVPLLAVAADFTSLTGAPDAGRRYVAINGDLNIHLLRPPRGPWFALDGTTVFSTTGVGQSDARLHDLQGPVGTASCAQVVDDRPSERTGDPPGS